MKPRVILPVQALLIVGLLSAGLQAQSVGIGTATPHPSARLHIEDNARGLLIPNVALSATNVATPVTGPATSLLVYNTATAGTGATAVSPGFYYWDGSQWVRLLGGGDAWLLTGNAGTNPATNFLGTTDAQPLVIATKNTTTPQPIQILVGNQETFRFNPPGSSAPAWSIQRSGVGGGGGNQRGLHAVDLQSARSVTTQVASGDYSVIGGGFQNTASNGYATVSGGRSNTASGGSATVGGGQGNTASSDFTTVGGGQGNTASGQYATISGGLGNTASSLSATVGGGQGNTASSYAIVGGGVTNAASGYTSVVGGGLQNTASGQYATVGGGSNDTASGGYATVSGGRYNIATGWYATVGGGLQNTASGSHATVGGGQQNTASGAHATVSGGLQNTASGIYSAIPGGSYLRVGNRSFGFSGQTSATQTDLSANSNIAAFVDVDLWLYSRDFTNASQLRFYEAQAHGSGANYVALRAPTSLSANTTYTLPASLTPTSTVEAGILQTDASGNLSWLSPAALAAATAWALTGNSITGTEFLGTTNAQPLVIRTNNTERMRVTASGDVGIGTSSPIGAVEVVREGASPAFVSTSYSDLDFAGAFVGRRARGTMSAPAAVQSGDALVFMGARGYDGTAFTSVSRAFIRMDASENWTPTAQGTRIVFATTANGTTSTAARVVIQSSGDVEVKGGNVLLQNSDNTARQLRLYEPSGAGTNFTAFQAQAQTSDITYTLPASAPATSAAWLQSDNTGAMSWRPVLYGTVSVDPPNINANTSTTFTVTITGVQTGDLVFLTPPSGIEGGLVFQGASVTAADQVTIRMRNVTGGAVNGAVLQWSYMVIRP